MTVTPAGRATEATSWIAVNWGMPTPEMTRVVQMEPGPTPTLMACTPALMRSEAPSAVTTLPATMGRSVSLRRLETTSMTRVVWPVAASMNRASAPAELRALARSRYSGPTPTAAPQRRWPCSSLEASANMARFWMSVSVMRPASTPFSSTRGSFSMRWV